MHEVPTEKLIGCEELESFHAELNPDIARYFFETHGFDYDGVGKFCGRLANAAVEASGFAVQGSSGIAIGTILTASLMQTFEAALHATLNLEAAA